MRVAITQPNYLPWSGYFDLLRSVDLWVCLDNVQVARRSFTVRNRIKSPQDHIRWLTVSLEHQRRDTLLCEARLHASEWWRSHRNRIDAFYRDAPAFRRYAPVLAELLPPRRDEPTLATYNRRLVLELASILGIRVEWRLASAIMKRLSGSAEEKIISLCREVGARELWNFRRGVDDGLYHADRFQSSGLALVKQTYKPVSYPQAGSTFVRNLSVVDLLMNVGDGARGVIEAGSRWERVEAI